MSVETIAGRYAKSLIELSLQNNALEAVKADMQAVQTAFSNRDFMQLMRNPIIPADKKIKTVNAIFTSLHTISSKFLNLVINKGRENLLKDISNSFIQQYNSLKNITSATLITAQPVDESYLQSIKAKFPAHVTVELKNEIKPEIIGGFILKFGDTLYDASVVKKLHKLKSAVQ